MRIAILFDNLGPYHLARLKAAAAAGMTVIAIETRGQSREYAWDKVETGTVLDRVTLVPHNEQDPGKREIGKRLTDLLARRAPDVIAIPGWSDHVGLTALRWARGAKVPVIVMSESNRDDGRRVWTREMVKRILLSLCAAGLAGGRRAAAYLEALGMPADRIATGYDVIDNAYFAAGADAARRTPDLRQSLALPDRYFLCCARFIAKKNLPFLIDAYARYHVETLAAGAQPWGLVIAGDGEERPAVEARIAAHGLGEAVTLAGFVQYDGLPKYYGLAGAFVLASTTEQWGLVVNEAMASGLPVLVSNRCGSAADLVKDGVNGLTFDPADEGALAARMKQIAEGDGQAMGSESARIIADWAPERFGASIATLARLVVDRPDDRKSVVALTTLDMLIQ
ncbi:glycosyltransferase [Sphingomonas immobilis]|uniref:Glycosyltransferase n=1 Tax=Sphingomonas immobilis TaxID=3063997 RepID=A0ABT8ZVY3_9SPHN|nr:glycosyltransferase [Sphingomonas sp. CA1-15]MDO7840921.1 glycosyltransferase [Sphingomonas sp. CA1-15]